MRATDRWESMCFQQYSWLQVGSIKAALGACYANILYF